VTPTGQPCDPRATNRGPDGDGLASAHAYKSGVPSALIDSFANAGLWTGTDSGGAASGELALTTVIDIVAPIGGPSSMRVDASSAAAGHRFERPFGPLDLTPYSELRWWTRCDRLADGSPSDPVRLRVELGSAALPIGSPGTWHRLVPVGRPNWWELTRVAIDDLDPQVATAADAIRFTIVDHTADGVDPSATVWLDDLLACEPRLVADVTDALIDELDGQLVLAGPVPAQLFVPGAAEPAVPRIRVIIDDVGFSDRRTLVGDMKTDLVDTGYRIRSESVAYDIRYRIEPVTTSPANYVEIVEFVIDTLAHRRALRVNGIECPLDRMPATDHDRRGDAPVLRYVAAARTDVTDQQVVVPVTDLDLTTEVSRP